MHPFIKVASHEVLKKVLYTHICKLVHIQTFYTRNKQLLFYYMQTAMAIFNSNVFIDFKLKLILPVQNCHKDSWKKKKRKKPLKAASL